MFSLVLASQRSGRFCFSAIPDACGPRNEGQLPLLFFWSDREDSFAPDVSLIFRTGTALASVAGAQLLPSTIIRRTMQSSAISLKLTCLLLLPTTLNS